MEIADSGRRIEPVEGLRHHRRVDRSVRERDGLGPTSEDGHTGQHRAERAAHAPDRLHGDEGGAGGHEHPRELPGPSRQVEDAGAGADAELAGQPADRVHRVVRAAALVGLGRRVEPNAGGGVDAPVRHVTGR